MKTLLTLLLLFAATAFADAPLQRGAAIPADAITTSLSEVFANPAAFTKEPIVTEGVIADVCRWAGCWMALSAEAGGPSMRVTFKGFSVSRTFRGRRARVHGRVKAVNNQPSFVADGIEVVGSPQ